MLSDRKKKILCAVVDGYVEKSSPISSKEIQENYLPECSSATIRNELSALESMGYLIQPHVSAGRVPSEKAFRFYVDQLASTEPLTSDEIEVIQKYFSQKISSMEDIITAVTHIISDVTNYTSVVVKSDMSDKIIAIRLVDLSNGKLLAVIVTDSRVLKDGIVDIPEDFSEQVLAQTERWLNNLFVGKHVSEFVNFEYPYTLINSQFEKYNAVFKKIIDVLKKVSLENGMDVETYGENKIFQHNEYAKVGAAEKFFEQLDQKQQLAKLFTDDGGQNGSVTIKIGAEDNAPEGCSVVTARVPLGDNISGSIGVIGPVRMNYKKVLCVLDKLSALIIDYMK